MRDLRARLQELGSRTTSKHDSRWLLPTIVMLLLVSALIMIALQGLMPGGDGQSRQATVADAKPVITPPADDAQEPRKTRQDVGSPRRAARRFVEGYVEFMYGQLDAQDIPSASPDLPLDEPRVSGAVMRRSPEIIRLQVDEGGSDTNVPFRATVDDGRRIYSVQFVMSAVGSRWLATLVAAG